MPSSPRGWLAWSARIRESKGRIHSAGFDYHSPDDPRMRGDSWETAIDVLMIAERSSHRVCRNGVGLKLMIRRFVNGEPREAFSTRQRSLLRKTTREFRRGLQEVGFIPPDRFFPR